LDGSPSISLSLGVELGDGLSGSSEKERKDKVRIHKFSYVLFKFKTQF